MTKNRIAKIAGIAAGATLAFGAFVPMVGAQMSVADLQAQINALMAQLATLQGGSSAGAQSLTTFNTNLTIGSKSTDVAALQTYLVANGYLVMPAGVNKGYFGPLTKAAVAAWQAANGISPAVGYFGPISRAKINALVGTSGGTSTGTYPAGCTSSAGYSSTTGQPCSGTSTSGGVITTPGVEGTITASVNPSPSTGTKLYEGDSMRQVAGIKLEAKSSDIKIERLKFKLSAGTSGNNDIDFYKKIAGKIYIMDGSTVLASADLNSSTVVKDSSLYYITVSGLNFIVPKNSTKVLYVALDAMSTWDSAFDGDTWTITVPVDGVRGVDGAGVNQYSPSTAFSRDFTSQGNLADSASLTISLNSATPVTNQVICNGGSNNDECDAVDMMHADFQAKKDDVLVTDLVLNITRTVADFATSTTAYLYDGSTLVGSAAVVGTSATAATATFTDIDWTVLKDTTKVLTVKLDIRQSVAAAQTFYVTITSGANVTVENSNGSSVTETGSATGKTMTVRKIGPQITLVSKSITTSGVPQTTQTTGKSTSTLSATFNVKIKAVGGSIMLGTVASGTPTFASSSVSFKVYRNGSWDTGSLGSQATSTSYSIPSPCATGSLTNSCTLSDGAEVTIPVTFSIGGRSADSSALASGSYSVQLEGLRWVATDLSTSAQTTNFMSGEADWRTADVSFP